MFYIAVCEDSSHEAAQIDSLLQAYRQAHMECALDVQFFKNAEQLLHTVQQGKGFDLFLLDILMPGMDGIVLSRRLREHGCRGVIIFLTATRDYAFEAFGVQAVDYLLKPLSKEELFPALDRALEALERREKPHYVLVKAAGADRIVDLADIVVVEVQGHTLCYYMANGEALKSKVLRVSFSRATAELTADARFIKPHQSFLVNAGHVASFCPQKFVLDNGMDIPISRLRYTAAKSQYMDYLASRGAMPGCPL